MHPETKKLTQKHALSNNNLKLQLSPGLVASIRHPARKWNGSILGQTYTRLLTYLLAPDPHGTLSFKEEVEGGRELITFLHATFFTDTKPKVHLCEPLYLQWPFLPVTICVDHGGTGRTSPPPSRIWSRGIVTPDFVMLQNFKHQITCITM